MKNILIVCVVVLMPVAHGWGQERELSAKELVALGKPATALVEVGRGQMAQGAGTAFCVHRSGIFITNHHVLTHQPRYAGSQRRRGATSVDEATLVLSPGDKGQREIKAHVIRRSQDLDLAVLKADAGDTTFPALELGTVDDLVETA